jgi:hypothetical protein
VKATRFPRCMGVAARAVGPCTADCWYQHHRGAFANRCKRIVACAVDRVSPLSTAVCSVGRVSPHGSSRCCAAGISIIAGLLQTVASASSLVLLTGYRRPALPSVQLAGYRRTGRRGAVQSVSQRCPRNSHSYIVLISCVYATTRRDSARADFANNLDTNPLTLISTSALVRVSCSVFTRQHN